MKVKEIVDIGLDRIFAHGPFRDTAGKERLKNKKPKRQRKQRAKNKR